MADGDLFTGKINDLKADEAIFIIGGAIALGRADELSRLMAIGKRFRRFTFTLLEIDSQLADRGLEGFVELFCRCAADHP